MAKIITPRTFPEHNQLFSFSCFVLRPRRKSFFDETRWPFMRVKRFSPNNEDRKLKSKIVRYKKSFHRYKNNVK